MTDVERYSRLIGATPPVNPDGWFAGTPEEQKSASRLARYITKVWIYENPLPDGADDLQRFDSASCRGAMEAYEASGGTANQGVEGGSLFETWAGHQLFEKKRHSVLLSDAASTLPIDGVTRVSLLSPAELVAVLEDLLPVWNKTSSASESEAAALMNLGQGGHVIRLRSRSPALDEIYYFDSWPGPSLLCDTNNKAGLRAQLAQQSPLRWSITRAEFEQAACALVVPTRALTWTRYGEALCPYAKLKETDVFTFFHLREAELFRANEVLRVRRCVTRAEGHDAEVEFFLDDSDVVRLARVSTDPRFAVVHAMLLADLIVHVFAALESQPDAGFDLAAMQALLARAVNTKNPSSHVGATLTVTVGLIQTEKGAQIVAEILPA